MVNKYQSICISLFAVATAIILKSCASVSEPMGGPKDEKKPKLVASTIQSYQTNVKTDKIELLFDEPVNLNNITEELIVTPLLPKGLKAEATGKKVTLKLNEELKPNTTYYFNFRQAIKDITEGNPADSTELVFSTGTYVDSLIIRGHVIQPETGEVFKDAIVALYPPSDTTNIRKHKPLYLTRSDAQGEFMLRNLPAAEFKLFAFNDKDKDLRFTNGSEKLAFLTTTVKTPSNSEYDLKLVPQNLDSLKLFDVEAGFNKCTLNFNRGIDQVRLVSTKPSQKLYISKTAKQIVLSWPNIKHDSIGAIIEVADSTGNKLQLNKTLKFLAKRPDGEKMVSVFSYDQQRGSKINPQEAITITAADSVTRLDTAAIKVLNDQDSIKTTSVKAYISNQGKTIRLEPVKWANEKFRLIIPAKSLKTLHDSTNTTSDTLAYNIAKGEEFGIIHIKVAFEGPFVVELLDGQSKVTRTAKGQKQIDWNYLNPGTYTLRLIKDTNQNGRWDAGNLLLGIEPEEIIYYKEKITIKANWEIDEITLP